MHAQTGADDDSERAFGADEELREVGAHCGTRRAARRDGRAVGEHDVEAGDDVLDLPVAGRELTGAAAREPAADGGERHRLWPVAGGDAVLGAELVLEHVAEGAGQHVDEHRPLVDGADTRQPGEIQQYAAECRDAGAADTAAPRGGGDRYPRVVARAEDLGDLRRGVGPHDDAGARGDAVLERPDHRERPPVAACFVDDLGGARHVRAGGREARLRACRRLRRSLP